MKIYGHDNVTILPTNPIEGRCVFLSPDGLVGALWYYNGYSWISLDTTDYARYKPQGERHLVLLEPTPATRFYWDPVDSAPNSQVAEVLPSGTVVSIAADIELPMAQDVYTLFGANSTSAHSYNHQVLPSVVETSEPGNFIRGYAGGVFKLGADLTNPAGILDSDIMCGIVVVGTSANYTARLVINGVEIMVASDSVRLRSLTPVLDTTLPLCSPSALNGLTGYVHSFSATFNGVAGDFGVASQWSTTEFTHEPISLLAFDTLNVKFAWYVDQNNLTSSLQNAHPFGAHPPIMYTTPQLHSTTVNNLFDWVSILDGGVAPDGYRHYYDVPTSAILNVRLDGNVDSWTWSGSEALDPVVGIHYNLEFQGFGQWPQFVFGGKYLPQLNDGNFIIQNSEIALHSIPYMFVVNAPNYNITNQSIPGPVAFTSGNTFSYPGIATRPNGGGGGYIQALNIGQPVLFEMWYSRMS